MGAWLVALMETCLTLQTPSGLAANETKIRLKSLLSKNALQLALKAGELLLEAAVVMESSLTDSAASRHSIGSVAHRSPITPVYLAVTTGRKRQSCH